VIEKALSDFHSVWHTCYQESKQSVEPNCYSFPPQLTSASALPEKMQ